MDPEVSRRWTHDEVSAMSTRDLWRLLFTVSSVLSLRMVPLNDRGNEDERDDRETDGSGFVEHGDFVDNPSGSPDLGPLVAQRGPRSGASEDGSGKAGGRSDSGHGARSRSR